MTYILLGIIIILLIILQKLAANVTKRGKRNYLYQKKIDLLTNNEFIFYKDLVKTADKMNLIVFTKVGLSDLIEPRKGQNWQAAFWRISQKHLDFVLCEKQRIRPLLAVELNDSSHERQDRKERDKFVEEALKSAGLPILWVKSSAELAPKIQMLLTKKKS